jgi:hypothetical protein
MDVCVGAVTAPRIRADEEYVLVRGIMQRMKMKLWRCHVCENRCYGVEHASEEVVTPTVFLDARMEVLIRPRMMLVTWDGEPGTIPRSGIEGW